MNSTNSARRFGQLPQHLTGSRRGTTEVAPPLGLGVPTGSDWERLNLLASRPAASRPWHRPPVGKRPIRQGRHSCTDIGTLLHRLPRIYAFSFFFFQLSAPVPRNGKPLFPRTSALVIMGRHVNGALGQTAYRLLNGTRLPMGVSEGLRLGFAISVYHLDSPSHTFPSCTGRVIGSNSGDALPHNPGILLAICVYIRSTVYA